MKFIVSQTHWDLFIIILPSNKTTTSLHIPGQDFLEHQTWLDKQSASSAHALGIQNVLFIVFPPFFSPLTFLKW